MDAAPKDVQTVTLEALDLAVPPKRRPRQTDIPYCQWLLLPIAQSVKLANKGQQPEHKPTQSAMVLSSSTVTSASDVWTDVDSDDSFNLLSMIEDSEDENILPVHAFNPDEMDEAQLLGTREKPKSLWTRFKVLVRGSYERVTKLRI